jgi:hypothetical protein
MATEQDDEAPAARAPGLNALRLRRAVELLRTFEVQGDGLNGRSTTLLEFEDYEIVQDLIMALASRVERGEGI